MKAKNCGIGSHLFIIILSIVMGFLICCHMVGGCSLEPNKLQFIEGYNNFNLGGAPPNYKMGPGIPGNSWTSPPHNPDKGMYASLANNVAGQVPLPEDQLFLFYNNKFSPECCYKPQQYSSSTGCACISTEQMKYISSRGGNNTLP